tara:strand:+ start:145 stop:1632 length:1488 start_codon:yes stop_codon:yes gene_type:complete
MQPSKELKGLVESYGQVGATDYQERKELERTVVNTIGVHMVSEGYTEDDVKEFFEKASAGKIVERFEEALENETATSYITEDGKFDTQLRHVEGAVHARLYEKGGASHVVKAITEAEKYKGMSGLQAFTSIVKNTFTGRGAAGIKADAEAHRKRYDDKPKETKSGIRYTTGDYGSRREGQRAVKGGQPVTWRVDAQGKGSWKGVKPMGTGDREAFRNMGATTDSVQPRPPKEDPKPKEAPKPKEPKADTSTRDTAPTTPPKETVADVKPQKVSTIHTYKKHGSDLHVGRHRTLAQHRAAVAAQKAKKNEEVEVQEDLGKTLKGISDKLKTSDHPVARAARALVTPVGKGRGTARPSVQVRDRIRKNQAGMESVDVELVTSFLVSEGFSDTPEGALIMLEGMSESWFNDILDVRLMEEAMLEYLQVMGEAESRDEALYIISEMDEEAIDILAEQVEEIMEKKVYTVTDLDKKGNTEAWKRYQQGNPQYKYGGLKGV